MRLPRFGGVFLYCRLRRAAGLGVAPSSQQTAPAGMVPGLTTDPRSAMAGQRAWPSIQNATVQTRRLQQSAGPPEVPIGQGGAPFTKFANCCQPLPKTQFASFDFTEKAA